MWSYIDANTCTILSSKKYGFRKGFSTTTQLVHVVHNETEALERKDDHHIISFDFSKAFDKVPHSLMLQKLHAYSFKNKVCSWTEEWLRDRVSVVSVNGSRSGKFSVRSGVLQGSVLRLLLYLLFIKDIPNRVKLSQCRLYADDTLLCSTNPKQDDLQHDVDELVLWAYKLGMTFNPLKCSHMQIGQEAPALDITINDTPIPPTDSMKYLSVAIDSSLTWDTHVHNIHVVQKLNRQLGVLKRHISHVASLNACATMVLFLFLL